MPSAAWTTWTWFFAGIAVGLLVALPAAWWWSRYWSRRTAARVRAAEQRARTNERLAELGTMTSGLAHEIKNPLSTIGPHTQLLREDVNELKQAAAPGTSPAPGTGPGPAPGTSPGPEIAPGPGGHTETVERLSRMDRRFGQLERETQRLRDILEDFLQFAGRLELDRQRQDVNPVIDELIDFYLPQAQQAGVNLRAQLHPTPLYAQVDASLLKQALLNMLINATQAMAQARDGDGDGRQATPHGGATDLILRTAPQRDRLGHDRVALHVIDTGPGMAPEIVDKVFQPYFSTKRGGSGLGLPTTRRIIEEHGGSIRVHSEPGRGTDFEVQLPAAESDASS